MSELPLFCQWVFQQEYLIKTEVMRIISIFLRCGKQIHCKCDEISTYLITILEPLVYFSHQIPWKTGVGCCIKCLIGTEQKRIPFLLFFFNPKPQLYSRIKFSVTLYWKCFCQGCVIAEKSISRWIWNSILCEKQRQINKKNLVINFF